MTTGCLHTMYQCIGGEDPVPQQDMLLRLPATGPTVLQCSLPVLSVPSLAFCPFLPIPYNTYGAILCTPSQDIHLSRNTSADSSAGALHTLP
ncbi:unnamed protein product [Medioppia subpectinata]|uniref:Uncharacterized protein n=1 Tax=Medioppia subpectinata TaxID=1979941 RepID=A0A7R9PU50_9ACAR|nr:unnamed protein product [Medioppia subpectinata]CAG2101188.1 unnamed protein product [Medioppia subpectinata]